MQVGGQGWGGPHGPNPGGGAGIAGDQAAVAGGKQVRVAQHLQAGLGQHPSAGGVDGQAAGRQPGRCPTARAGQVGGGVARHQAMQGDRGRRQQALPRPVGGSGAKAEALAAQQQLRPIAAGSQRQRQFHRRLAAAADADRGAWGQAA